MPVHSCFGRMSLDFLWEKNWSIPIVSISNLIKKSEHATHGVGANSAHTPGPGRTGIASRVSNIKRSPGTSKNIALVNAPGTYAWYTWASSQTLSGELIPEVLAASPLAGFAFTHFLAKFVNHIEDTRNRVPIVTSYYTCLQTVLLFVGRPRKSLIDYAALCLICDFKKAKGERAKKGTEPSSKRNLLRMQRREATQPCPAPNAITSSSIRLASFHTKHN
jgi:hypothetical protein